MPNLVEMVDDPEPLGEPLLSDADLQVYVDAFTRTGFTGGINWYRNLDRNWEETPELAGARITVPSLMVVAEWDAALRPELAEPMKGLVDDLEVVTIPRCGHWTQQEHPDELNRDPRRVAPAAFRQAVGLNRGPSGPPRRRAAPRAVGPLPATRAGAAASPDDADWSARRRSCPCQ